jgi:hypothetical protein
MVKDATTLNGVLEVDGARQIKGNLKSSCGSLVFLQNLFCVITSFLPWLIMTEIVFVALVIIQW